MLLQVLANPAVACPAQATACTWPCGSCSHLNCMRLLKQTGAASKKPARNAYEHQYTPRCLIAIRSQCLLPDHHVEVLLLATAEDLARAVYRLLLHLPRSPAGACCCSSQVAQRHLVALHLAPCHARGWHRGRLQGKAEMYASVRHTEADALMCHHAVACAWQDRARSEHGAAVCTARASHAGVC
jgi:hypothetical protein